MNVNNKYFAHISGMLNEFDNNFQSRVQQKINKHFDLYYLKSLFDGLVFGRPYIEGGYFRGYKYVLNQTTLSNLMHFPTYFGPFRLLKSGHGRGKFIAFLCLLIAFFLATLCNCTGISILNEANATVVTNEMNSTTLVNGVDTTLLMKEVNATFNIQNQQFNLQNSSQVCCQTVFVQVFRCKLSILFLFMG